MANIVVRRRVATDPTSTALMLAGPSAFELWPGIEPVGETEGHLHLAVPGVDDDVRVDVELLAPSRTATGFVLRFAGQGNNREVPGELRLHAASDGDFQTDAELWLGYPDDGPAADEVRRMAERFLVNLMSAVEARSRVA